MSSLTASAALPVSAQSPMGGAGSADELTPRRLLAFVTMCFGMFMAFLDIQIVSSSLSEIQAGLSASADEIPWVQTSYLIAEVIAIPLSGFLSRALGTRVLFTVSAAGFTLASIMCGLSSSIDSMIVWRALQGFIGGGMVPTVFASAYLIFPGPRQKYVAPVVGLIATLAPTIGPTIGGYVTDAFSWHWLFFINIVPGLIVTAATYVLVDFDRARSFAAGTLRLVGPLQHGGLPRRARIRPRRGSAQGLVRRRRHHDSCASSRRSLPWRSSRAC